MGIFNFFNGRKKILEEKKIILEESKKRLKDESTGSDISSKNTDVKESNDKGLTESKIQFCTDCGSKQEGNSFCTECGKSLSIVSSDSKPSELNTIANEGTEQNSDEKFDDAWINFKNLKEENFDEIKSPKPHSGVPEDFFNQDIDGSWYFTVMNFSMLFKSFSNKTFDIELDKLLTANNFEIENKFLKIRDYWIGKNFNIEIPKSDTNLIIISNEKITHKTSLDIRETNITKITHEFEWIDGFKIYDFEDFAKNQSDLLNATNVPMYFKLPDEDEGSIIITVPTENIGNSIIDQVINKNGSHISFRSTEQDEWTNLYKGYEFVIGYFPERDHVRINQLPQLNVESIDHELRMRIFEFDEAFFMDKYEMDEAEV